MRCSPSWRFITRAINRNDCGTTCNIPLYDGLFAAYIWFVGLLLVVTGALTFVFWRKENTKLWPPIVGIVLSVIGAITVVVLTGFALPGAG